MAKMDEDERKEKLAASQPKSTLIDQTKVGRNGKPVKPRKDDTSDPMILVNSLFGKESGTGKHNKNKNKDKTGIIGEKSGSGANKLNKPLTPSSAGSKTKSGVSTNWLDSLVQAQVGKDVKTNHGQTMITTKSKEERIAKREEAKKNRMIRKMGKRKVVSRDEDEDENDDSDSESDEETVSSVRLELKL